MRALRVVVAGFGPIYRAGLCSLLPASDGGQPLAVVGQAGDLRRAMAQIRLLRPDVILSDGYFTGSGAPSFPLRSIAALREAHPGVAVVVLTDATDVVPARSAFAEGAVGYVIRPVEPDLLRAALHTAAAGDPYIDPRLGDLAPRVLESPSAALSQRELEVLQLLGLGHTNGEVAQRLVLSVRTIETHRSNIQRKLGIRSRADLARAAFRHAGAALTPSARTTSA